jgi:CRISPR-associated protein Cmr2
MDMERLEDERRNASGQARHEVDEKIQRRREQCLQRLLETEPDGPSFLVSGFADKVAVWFSEQTWPRRGDARSFYRNVAHKVSENGALALPQPLNLDPWPPKLLHDNWLAFEIEFSLQTPWYSKDDRLFHVLDNPVRKDRVFGVPYMSAASWKGMLRWACRIQAGLQEHLRSGKRFDDWNDPEWILHLFGNQKGEDKNFHQGALVFYPTWFDKIGFEVINPHDRRRRAGTQPIFYEVVPGRRPKPGNPQEFEDGGKGSLRLLYAPWPGMKPPARPSDFLSPLLESIEQLLRKYGVSAKRTVGWGTAEIGMWRGWWKEQQPIEASSRKEFQKQIEQWLKVKTAP